MMVKLIKLVTGEEILAEVLSSNEKTLEVQKAIRFMATNQGLMPLEFPLMVKENSVLSIDTTSIIFTCEPSDKALEAYQGYFSDIIQPPKGGLIV